MYCTMYIVQCTDTLTRILSAPGSKYTYANMFTLIPRARSQSSTLPPNKQQTCTHAPRLSLHSMHQQSDDVERPRDDSAVRTCASRLRTLDFLFGVFRVMVVKRAGNACAPDSNVEREQQSSVHFLALGFRPQASILGVRLRALGFRV